MPWFPTLCRNLGLTAHHLVKPLQDDRKQTLHKSTTVEEEKLNATTTLRRTTIEEIEITPPEIKSTQK